ncbi:GNAT family N-acetyltransferase [Azohydromonas aeria]|uniref:GNAT family N-acetyltransferase n=1 Tax=Azohydromonas aeria TaxID=2590212 RepID=UPI0012FCEEC7|nr:GNAT family N-acetyltransferase [Azohydromonas aeria]
MNARRIVDTAPAPVADWGRTPQLRLRELGPADAADLLRMHREPRVRAQLTDDYPLDDPAVLRFFLARMAVLYRQHEGLGIWRADVSQPTPDSGGSDAFAGWFSLMPMPDKPGAVELGSRLLPATWGRGVVFDGTALLLEHAFTRLGLGRVWATCHPVNRSARAVLLALGFSELGPRPYGDGVALHFRLGAPAWRAACALPRRQRLRAALRPPRPGTTPAATPIPNPTEETSA